jgi:DNA-binding winged helix-turn-helix (wHTH) protein
MRVRFTEEFVADLETRQLFRSGNRLSLQDKPFRLLELLLAQPLHVVTYDEIERFLWPDVNVDTRHGTKEAVLKVREALGHDAHRLQCVRGRGYRLIVEDITFAADTDSAFTKALDACATASGITSARMLQ